ncbi:MAG: hypothetical protein GX605_13375, partial [Chloroflexi bacterium]|nr:hypothetical protein [Chloroflexota bacterium]
LLFEGRERLALGAAAFTAFIPGFCYLGGAVSNDNLLVALAALLLWRLLLLLHGSDSPRHWLRIGALFGLAVLTKLSLSAFAALFVAAAFYRLWRGQTTWRQALGRLALAATVALAVCGWWLAHNLRTYGDPLGWNLILGVVDRRTCPIEVGWLLRGLFESFWGRFGGAAHIRLPLWLYGLFAAASTLALVGLAKRLWRLAHDRGWQGRGHTVAAWGLMAAWLALIVILLVRYTLTALGTNQARLLYPALPILAAGLWLGLRECTPRRWGRPLAWAANGALVLCNLGILFGFLAPLYGPPAAPSVAEIQAMSPPLSLEFGGQARLLGYRLAHQRLAPLAPTELTLYWQALTDVEEDYRVSLWVEGPPPYPATEIKRAPAAGRSPTDLWRAGQVVADRYRLSLPATAPLGAYHLALGLRGFDSQEWLQPSTAQGDDSPRVPLVTLAYQAEGLAALPPTAQTLAAEFEGQLRLVGYALQEITHPTRAFVETLRVTLYWQALGAERADLTAFVHLVDGQGRLAAGHDGMPFGGTWPTSAWPAGGVFADVHDIALDGRCPGDMLTPVLGLYPSPAGPRLAIGDGDHVSLPPYRVSSSPF